MTARFSARTCSFLDSPNRFAVLGTTNEDGSVHQAVVWYERRGETIVVNARYGRRWAANTRRTRRLSVAVADGQDYVIVHGHVDVVDDPETSLADIRALARRYGDDATQFDDQRRITFVVRPERLALHGRLVGEQ